ncbi:MAG: hypothetical protein ABUT20_06980 [Bacteroidota bacterium]
MEVHAHTHTERKKWTHYLWEFFMLFLAVFCGFLAENQREHFVEHQREKQFMRSLIEDLETDTIELRRAMGKADMVALYSDSALMFLRTYEPSSQIPMQLSNLIGRAGQRQVLINTDRTSAQLKNSGAMRLIRNKEINNLILQYWKQIDETNISLDRYLLYRNAGREITFKLWLIPEVYEVGSFIHSDSIQVLKVIDKDPKKWGELKNLIAMGGTISREAHLNNLQKQLTKAKELIAAIRDVYHFKD